MHHFNVKATFDKNFYVVKQNEGFYDYLCLGSDVTLETRIHPDDLVVWKNTVDVLNHSLEDKSFASLRIRRFDSTYRWCLIDLSKNTREQYLVSILDIQESLTFSKQTMRNEKALYAFLEMLDEFVFTYDPNADLLTIRLIKELHRVTLFQGLLEDWSTDMLASNVSDGYEDVFESFCKHMENMCDDTVEIVLDQFFGNREKKLYTFQCRTITFEERKPLVVGVIRQNHKNNNQSVVMGLDYSKDPGMDILTRKAITEYAKRSISTSFGKKIYLILLNLDNFQEVNARLGDMFGDEVLSSTAKIVKDVVDQYGMVGRVGGDEIMIVLEFNTDLPSLRNILRTIRTNIEWTFQKICNDVHVTCTMGAANFPEQGSSFEEVYEVADKMLQLGKKKGKNRYIIFRPEIHGDSESIIQQEFNPEYIQELRNNKVAIMQRLLDKYLISQSITNESIFHMVGHGFEYQEILLVCNHGSISFQWKPDHIANVVEQINPPTLQVRFIQAFDQNNCFISNDISDYDEFPDIQYFLKKENAGRSIFYKFGMESITPGYLLFIKERSPEGWTDYDILVTTQVAKAIEMSMENR